jgi:hypothetical protein
MKRLIPLLLLAMLAGCKKDKNSHPSNPFPIQPGEGVFPLVQANPSRAEYIRLADGKVFPNIYRNLNGKEMGDFLTDGVIFNDRIYLVLKDSDRIEVVSIKDFKPLGTIGPIHQPNNILVLPSGKAYISLQSKHLYRVDLPNLAVIDSIELEGSAASYEMALLEGTLYVGSSAKIYLVDTTTNTNIGSFSIPVSGRISCMVVDAEGKLWTYSPIAGRLLRLNISPAACEIEKNFAVQNGSFWSHPRPLLQIDTSGQTLYFQNKDLFRMSIHDTSFPSVPIVQIPFGGQYLNGFGINPHNNRLFTSTILRNSRPYKSQIVHRDEFGVEIEQFILVNGVASFLFY